MAGLQLNRLPHELESDMVERGVRLAQVAVASALSLLLRCQ